MTKRTKKLKNCDKFVRLIKRTAVGLGVIFALVVYVSGVGNILRVLGNFPTYDPSAPYFTAFVVTMLFGVVWALAYLLWES